MDPYGGRDTLSIAMSVVKGARPDISPVVPQHIAALMRRCWDTNPHLRPSFDGNFLKFIFLNLILIFIQ